MITSLLCPKSIWLHFTPQHKDQNLCYPIQGLHKSGHDFLHSFIILSTGKTSVKKDCFLLSQSELHFPTFRPLFIFFPQNKWNSTPLHLYLLNSNATSSMKSSWELSFPTGVNLSFLSMLTSLAIYFAWTHKFCFNCNNLCNICCLFH